MKYLINYSTGAVQWADEVNMAAMASMIQAGVVISIIDVAAKRALISNNVEGKLNIGWADIPKYASFNPDEISILEEDEKKSEQNLEVSK